MGSPVVWQPATVHGMRGVGGPGVRARTESARVAPGGVSAPTRASQGGVTVYRSGRRQHPGAEPRGSGQPSAGTSVGGPRRGATVAVHKGR